MDWKGEVVSQRILSGRSINITPSLFSGSANNLRCRSWVNSKYTEFNADILWCKSSKTGVGLATGWGGASAGFAVTAARSVIANAHLIIKFAIPTCIASI
jgi:hypothetical protein